MWFSNQVNFISDSGYTNKVEKLFSNLYEDELQFTIN